MREINSPQNHRRSGSLRGEGSVLLDGQEINGPSWKRGMVFQDFALAALENSETKH